MGTRLYPVERNRQFIAAREATPSTVSPGFCMSRRELADAVNVYLSAKTGKEYTAMDAQAIGKYERGETRWPSGLYREAFRTVLGVATDAELGFWPVRRGVTAARVPVRSRSASVVPVAALPLVADARDADVVGRHDQLAAQFVSVLAGGQQDSDGAARRRAAQDMAVDLWLFLDQFTRLVVRELVPS